ncbi:Bud site selection protein, Revert to axial protein 1 [Naganishia albida]|nr:Bud site selection protein, Revert to axial protein 1 [Naganishia albida]
MSSPLLRPRPGQRSRLPELSDVLMRRTRAPLDLYCFYIFLQQENAEDALDCWLDMQQHENLCRAYFKDLRKTGRSVEEDWPEFWDYARRHGSIFSSISGVNENSISHQGQTGPPLASEKGTAPQYDEKYRDHEGEQFEDATDDEGLPHSARFRARRDTEAHVSRTPQNLSASNTPQMLSSPDLSPEQNNNRFAQPSPAIGAPSIGKSSARGPSRASFVDSFFGTATGNSMHPGSGNDAGINQHGEILRNGTTVGSRGVRRVSRAPTVIPRKQAITQQDLVASGERIYLRYLLPGAEKEIYLPPPIRIHEFPSDPEIDDDPSTPADPRIPDYFHSAKEYIFKALQDDAFVRFIRAKAFCNLTRLGTFIRLFAGLFCLWASFVVAFTLVFYDYQPKIRRLYLIIPFFFAFYFLISACYALDPLLVLLNRSETHPFQTIKMGEPYVQKILRGRAALVMAEVMLLTAIMAIIWYFVPGHRL